MIEQPFRKPRALLGTKACLLSKARHGETERMEHHLGLLGRHHRRAAPLSSRFANHQGDSALAPADMDRRLRSPCLNPDGSGLEWSSHSISSSDRPQRSQRVVAGTSAPSVSSSSPAA